MANRGDDAGWSGPRPLDNPLTVARLGAIYTHTAAFYDNLVGEKQANAKRTAIDLLQRQERERFLEIGVGTGWAFRRVTAATGADGAYGLDVAQGMLDVARAVLANAAHSDASSPEPKRSASKDGTRRAEPWINGTPSLLLGDGRALPFPSASLDCLLNTYTFEVMGAPDIAAMLDEMLRVLRPGGRAVIVNLTDATDGGAADEAMILDWKVRYETDPEYFGGARPLQLTEMLRAHGFMEVTRRYVGPEWPSEVLLGFRR